MPYKLLPCGILMAALVCPVFTSCSDDDDDEVDPSNGHAYVDLGLPSGALWATCNVGATASYECGDYYAWGETKTKSTYKQSNYFDSNNWKGILDDPTFNKYNSVSNGYLELQVEDDVAAQEWGGKWRTPTAEDYNELITYCEWVYTSSYKSTGVKGVVCFKMKASGEYDVDKDTHIFFPSTGFALSESVYYQSTYCDYWSRTLRTTSNTPDITSYCFHGDLSSKVVKLSSSYRSTGLVVRPVLFK